MACSSLQLQGGLLVQLSSGSRGSRGPSSATTSVFGGHVAGSGGKLVFYGRSRTKTRAATEDLRLEMDENPEGIISGEWPENFSLLSYEDLRAYLKSQIISDEMKPSTMLGVVMSAPVWTARGEQTLGEIEHHFEAVSGLPVVDDDQRCIGVISKKHIDKATHGLNSKVGEVMSSPAITLSQDKTVMDAAAVMLKMKVHRIPITNAEKRVIGIVTRSDIFRALETLTV